MPRGGHDEEARLRSLSLSLVVLGSGACSVEESARLRVDQQSLTPAPGEDTGLPGVDDRVDDPPLPHGSCWPHQRPAGSDPFGPPVSHGIAAAPGYAPDRFDDTVRLAFRAATLQHTQGSDSIYWSGIELPNSDPSAREVESLADAAVRLSGFDLAATAALTTRRSIRSEDATQTWSHPGSTSTSTTPRGAETSTRPRSFSSSHISP